MPTDFEINVPTQISGVLTTIEPIEVIDIFLVAMLFYKIYDMLQNTRAATLVKGVIVFMVITGLTSFLNFGL